MVLRFPFGFVWAFFSPGEGFSSTQEDWALGRFICQWTIHCCYCWSFCVLATTISFCTCPAYLKIRPATHFTIRRLGYQSTFRLMMSANPLWSSYYQTKGRGTWELLPCSIGAVTWLHLEQVPSHLQALGPAFTKRIPGNNSPNYGRISSAVILQRDEREGKEETCLPDSLALLLGYLYASSSRLQDTRLAFFTRLPDVNSSDHGPDSSANTLQMDETEGDMIHCRPSPLAMLLVYMSASLQSPPSH